MLVYCLHGLCTFPNIVINKKITRKSGKLRRKRIDMMWTVVNNVGVLFTWSVHISKYGNQHRYNQKIRQNHFSHPFLGTYEVHQFLDLGYLEGTHSSMVYVTHTIPWYCGMATLYHSRVFPHTTALIPYQWYCL